MRFNRLMNRSYLSQGISLRGLSTKRTIPPRPVFPPPPPQPEHKQYVPYISSAIMVFGFIFIYSLPADVDEDYITFNVGPGMEKGPKIPPSPKEISKQQSQQ